MGYYGFKHTAITASWFVLPFSLSSCACVQCLAPPCRSMQNSFDISARVDKHCAKQVFAAPRKLADVFVGKAFPRQAPHMTCTSPRSHVSQQSSSCNYFSMHDLVQILYSCICFCIHFFMQRLSERLSLHLSLFTWTLFHGKHTEHVRQKQKTQKQICAFLWPTG